MRAKYSRAGFSLLELLIVLVVFVLLAMMILPAMSGIPGPKARIQCVSNLKQVGLAYALWADDHGGRLPAAIPVSQGGWSDLLTNGNAGRVCWTNYVIMGPYIKYPRLLICPHDIRKPATTFVIKGSPQDRGNADFNKNASLSYFVGVTASLRYPQSILAGNRNLSAGSKPQKDFGFSPADDSGNDVVVQTNGKSAYCWSLKMHSRRRQSGDGDILFMDGSVQCLKGSRLADCFAKAGVPKLEQMTNSAGQLPPPGPDFRLVFP